MCRNKQGFSTVPSKCVVHTSLRSFNTEPCVGQVLHVETEPESFLYVTDYTKPPIASRLPRGATQTWAENLGRFVFKMSLRDGQEDAVEQIECGEIYSIRKVRAIMSVVNGQFQGRLGGNDRLIKVLSEEDEMAKVLLK